MKYFKFKSLTMRIWATFTLIILIIVSSISFFYIFAFKKFSESAKINDLTVTHDMLLKNNDFDKPFNRFGELRNLKGSDFFIVNIDDKNNITLNDINKGHPPDNPKGGEPHMLAVNNTELELWMASYIKDGSIYEKQFNETYKNLNFLFVISSIQYGNSGKSYLISYMPNIEDNSLLYVVLVTGFVFIIIGFFTAKIVANNISKPLKELEGYTIRIAHKDWKEPIKIRNADEIGRLAESMNQMQKELRRADEEEKMFLQSISHDLKTPVMVIMSHAEAIRDGVYIDSVEKTAEIIRDEAIGLEKKIKQLLYLNTLDYVMEKSNDRTEINLYNLLSDMVCKFEVINSKIRWNVDLDEVKIQGDLDKIKVSIENILDNALRYTENNISVTLKKEDNFGILEIYNDGPNISKEHIAHIFDNFYKDRTGNFGLGLAITKKIIDFHNGKIEAVNRKKGVSFIIRFPIEEIKL